MPEAKTRKNFHGEFKSWLLTVGDIDEEKWFDIVSKDDDHDYVAYPIEKGPGIPLQSSSPTNDDDPLNDVSLGPNPATYEF